MDYLSNLANTNKIIVAYSGGMDSHVLLHQLKQQNPLLHLTAVHINHHLHSESNQWSAHCKNICDTLNIPFIEHSIDIKKQPNESLETAARRLRYTYFKTLMDENTLLAVAHHQDDQAETLLFRLMRGTGVQGLSGMRLEQPFGKGKLIRPLLKTSRQQLFDYAMQHELDWIEDPSNTDIYYSRNYLRHEVLPLLEKKWPQVKQQLSNTSQHMHEASQLLSELAQIDMPNTDFTQTTLSLEKWLSLKIIRQKNVLRHWLEHHQGFAPTTAQLNNMMLQLNNQRNDKQPMIEWGSFILRKMNNELILEKKNKKIGR